MSGDNNTTQQQQEYGSIPTTIEGGTNSNNICGGDNNMPKLMMMVGCNCRNHIHDDNDNNDNDATNNNETNDCACHNDKLLKHSSLRDIPTDDSVEGFLRRLTSFDEPDTLVRFLVLFLVSLIPFGGHFFKSSLSSLEVFMLEDEPLNMDATRYGLVLSSFAFGKVFLSLVGGHYIDKVDDRKGIMTFISIVLFGQILFAISLQIKSYWLLFFAGVLYGSAQGVVTLAHRAIVSRYFANYEIIFAIGWTHGVACLSKMAARAGVVPIANYFGSYIAPFYVMIAITIGSVIAALAYIQLTTPIWNNKKSNSSFSSSDDVDHHHDVHMGVDSERTPLTQSQSPRSQKDYSNALSESEMGIAANANNNTTISGGTESDSLILASDQDDLSETTSGSGFHTTVLACLKIDCTLSTAYWLICTLHCLYLMVFHLFPNISGHFLHQRHGMSPEEAGYVSSLLTAFAIVGAPATGYILDKSGGQLHIIIAAGFLTIISYTVLSFTDVPPIYNILGLSIADVCIPTILHALLPLSVDISQYGFAFGISEFLDAIGNIAGNITVGFLRDRTGSYLSSMVFIIILNIVGIVLSIILLFHDKKKHDSFYNSAMRK